MDLLGQVAVIVIILVVVFTAAFILTTQTQKHELTAAQAKQFVINDLKASNPSANITVINISNSSLEKGSYDIVLSIVYNATRPCPTLFIEGFDYPATGLVPSVDNLYTKNCIIYGLSNAPSYVISSPEIAIARSYNQGIGQITNYVSAYGYNNTAVTATFYPYLNDNQTNLGQNFYNVWLIRYRATDANYSVYAVLDSSGAVSGNYTATP
ncbi:MAG: hypothetical protein KGI06_01900 [Candidatus Micrarchaeota archaeon]|nr:hypothetical protein [Candidatus Micrarchaeota archaeon]